MPLFNAPSSSSALLLVAALWLSSPAALACSCLPPPPPLESAAQSTVVFVGKPIAEHRGEKNPMRSRRMEFVVDEILSGTGKETLFVSTGRDSASCGYNFQIGESYLVYAHGEVTALQTDICTRTARTGHKSVAEEIALLRDAKLAKPPAK